MNRKLEEILGDFPEAEVKTSAFEATVIKKTGEYLFEIRDGDTVAKLEVDKVHGERMDVGTRYKLFSPEKISKETMRLPSNSYPKKLFVVDASLEPTIRLKNYLQKTNWDIIKGKLLVTVLTIYDKKITSNGKDQRYIKTFNF